MFFFHGNPFNLKKFLRAFRQDVFFLFFLASNVEERLWWPIHSPDKGRKKKAKG